VEEKANALGFDLRGKIAANSEWRIYKHLIKNRVSK